MQKKKLITISFFSVTTLISLNGLCQGASLGPVIYSQKVRREDHLNFVEMFQNRRGIIFLTKDSISFVVKKKKNKKFNFSLPYSEIVSIRKGNTFIYPNIIKIKTTSGYKFKLFTFKRRNIIRVAGERMQLIRK
jgi:hypothetical protein